VDVLESSVITVRRYLKKRKVYTSFIRKAGFSITKERSIYLGMVKLFEARK
jgi:hypothetical protein